MITIMDIPENKIREVLFMIKMNKTKKSCCEHLGIPYNTKKLDTIIQRFNEALEKQQQQKIRNKTRIFTSNEIKQISEEYLSGEPISKIAENYALTSYKVKKLLVEHNIPIRSNSKKKEAQVDHIVQDLNIKFKLKDKVFSKKYNCFAIIDKIYDEEYVDYLRNPISKKYVELPSLVNDKYGKRKNIQFKEGIHYNIMYEYKNESIDKVTAEYTISSIENSIITFGMESYRIWVMQGNHKFYASALRDQLVPVEIKC